MTEANPVTGVTIAAPASNIRFRLPHGFEWREDAGRVLIWETDNLRSPRVIFLWRSKAAPDGDGDERACIGDTVFNYRMTRRDGGSGGSEFEIDAHTSVDGGILNASFRFQQEGDASLASINIFWRFLAGVDADR